MVAEIGILMLGTIGGLGLIASAGVEPANRFMTRHPRVAEFFNWVEDDLDEDDKKAPAAATAGTKNFRNNIYPLSLTQREDARKAAK